MAAPNGYYRTISSLTNTVSWVDLTSSNFDFGAAKSDGSDIRVYDATADATCPLWLFGYDQAAQVGRVYFKATTTGNTHRLYYGDPSASAVSSFSGVFTNGSGFDSGSLGDLSSTTSGSGAVTGLHKATGLTDTRYRRVLRRSATPAIATSAISSRPVVREMSLLTDPDGNIVQESGDYIAYFVAQGSSPNYGQTYRATSTDLVSWTVNTTAVLELGSSGTYDDHGARVATVLKMGTGDYRMWYTVNGSAGGNGVGYATSTDGTSWTKVGNILTQANCGITSYTPILSGVPDVKRIADGSYVMFCEARPSTGNGYPWSIFGWTSPDVTGGGTWTVMNSGGYVIDGSGSGFASYGAANPHFWEITPGSLYALYAQGFSGSGTDLSTFNGQGAFWTASSPSGSYTVDSAAPIFGVDNTVSNFGEEAGGLAIGSGGAPVLFMQDYSIAGDHLNTASNIFRVYPVTDQGGLVLTSATTGGALLTRLLAAGNFTAEARSILTAHRSTNAAPYILGVADSASAPTPDTSTNFAAKIRVAIRRATHGSASPGAISILYMNTSSTLVYYDGSVFNSTNSNTCGSSDMDREIVSKIRDDGTNYYFDVSYADTGTSIVSVSVAKSSVKSFTNSRYLFGGDPFTNAWQAGIFYRYVIVRPYASSDPTITLGARTAPPLTVGSFVLTGQAAALKMARKVIVAAGSYALSGQAATLRATRTMTASAGAYTFTGVDASLVRALVVQAAAGSFALAGQDAGLQYARRMAASAGSFDLAGIDVNLIRGRALVATVGTFALTGQDASLLTARRLVASAGSITLTGVDADLVYDALATVYTLDAATGDFALAGQDAALLRGYTLAAGAGSYDVTGEDADLSRTRVLQAAAGVYALTGHDAVLTSDSVPTSYDVYPNPFGSVSTSSINPFGASSRLKGA